jgi:hypothetical protein
MGLVTFPVDLLLCYCINPVWEDVCIMFPGDRPLHDTTDTGHDSHDIVMDVCGDNRSTPAACVGQSLFVDDKDCSILSGSKTVHK